MNLNTPISPPPPPLSPPLAPSGINYSPKNKHRLLTLGIIVAVIAIGGSVIGISVYLNNQQALQNQSKAAVTSYTGLLLNTSQNRCEYTDILCYKIQDYDDKKRLTFAVPDGVRVKKREMNRLLHKQVTIKGILLNYTKSDGTKIPYVLVREINQLGASYTLFDDKGFLLVNGQRFLPLGMYAESPDHVEKVAQTGINTVWLVDNFASSSNNHASLRKAQEKGLWAIPMGYGESSDSFDCDLRQKPPDYVGPDPKDSTKNIDCTVCTTVGKLCPESCNYCNASYVPAYIAEVKVFPHIIGHTAHDEPGNLVEYMDKDVFAWYKELKTAAPQRLTFTQDILHCYARKDNTTGKWVVDKNAGVWCRLYDKTIPNTLGVFRNPYIDVTGAESGYFDKPKSDRPIDVKVKDDIQQLIGALEYFRQETNKQTIQAWLQVGGMSKETEELFTYIPTFNEVRSMFYASLGHQARGVHFGLWETSLDTPHSQQVLSNIKAVIDEAKANNIIEDYLKNYNASQKVSSEDPDKIDVTAFYSNKSFYLIAVNITSSRQNNIKVIFPALPSNLTGIFVGEGKTKTIAQGATFTTLDFSPHEARVLKLLN